VEFPAPHNLNIGIRGNEHVTPLGRLVTLSIEGQVVFYAHRDGTIDQVLLSQSTLSPALDSTLMAAVQRLDSNRTLPAFPSEIAPDLIRLRLTLGGRDRRSPGQPFFVTRQATWKLDRPASGSRYNRAPEYPVNARLAGVTDSLVLSFVIDETGAAVMSTARFLAGTYRDFKLAVLEVIPGYKFNPAMIAGCPVAQRVAMPFVFSLER
jgi:outer membrane biosynthesis protein TonB